MSSYSLIPLLLLGASLTSGQSSTTADVGISSSPSPPPESSTLGGHHRHHGPHGHGHRHGPRGPFPPFSPFGAGDSSGRRGAPVPASAEQQQSGEVVTDGGSRTRRSMHQRGPAGWNMPPELVDLFNLTMADERALVVLIAALNSTQQANISAIFRNASRESLNALNTALQQWATQQGGQVPALLGAYLASQKALRAEILLIHNELAANLSADARQLDGNIMAVLNNDDLSPIEQCVQLQPLLQNVSQTIAYELGAAFGRLPRHNNCNSTGWGHGHGGHKGGRGMGQIGGVFGPRGGQNRGGQNGGGQNWGGQNGGSQNWGGQNGGGRNGGGSLQSFIRTRRASGGAGRGQGTQQQQQGDPNGMQGNGNQPGGGGATGGQSGGGKSGGRQRGNRHHGGGSPHGQSNGGQGNGGGAGSPSDQSNSGQSNSGQSDGGGAGSPRGQSNGGAGSPRGQGNSGQGGGGPPPNAGNNSPSGSSGGSPPNADNNSPNGSPDGPPPNAADD